MGQTTPLGFLDSSAFWIACVITWPPFHYLPPDHSLCLLIYLQSPIYLHRLIWRYSLVSRIIHGFLSSLFYLWVPCPLLYVNSSFIGVDAGSQEFGPSSLFTSFTSCYVSFCCCLPCQSPGMSSSSTYSCFITGLLKLLLVNTALDSLWWLIGTMYHGMLIQRQSAFVIFFLNLSFSFVPMIFLFGLLFVMFIGNLL